MPLGRDPEQSNCELLYPSQRVLGGLGASSWAPAVSLNVPGAVVVHSVSVCSVGARGHAELNLQLAAWLHLGLRVLLPDVICVPVIVSSLAHG